MFIKSKINKITMKTGVKVIDAMTKAPIVVGPNETIKSCAEKMIEHGVGSLLIKKDEKLLGILTEKDMVDKVVLNGLNTLKTPVKKVMTRRSLITINPGTDLYDAILLMRDKGKKRLPVMDKRKVLGLLTYRDILKLQPDLYEIYIEKLKLKMESNKFPDYKHKVY